jgi:hypothetical protein
MRSTAIERRRVLATAAAFGVAPWLPRAAIAAAANPLYLSARVDLAARAEGSGKYFFSGIDPAGARTFDIPLPGRGHGAAMHPRAPLAVVFARRPGRFALAIDIKRGRVAARIAPPDDRHFYGHGVFSGDGRLLYACENDYERRRGVIGIYAVERGFARVGEWQTHGIGPHDIALMPGCATLAVANGGIATHPDLPRLKLNIPTMAPSLAFLDRRDGRLIAQHRLPKEFHKASIRHLSVAGDGRVVAAMQYEGPKGDLVPLLAVSERAGPLRMLDKPATAIRALRQYCGSVAFDTSGAVIAASSPRGDVLTFWEAASGRHLFTATIADGCGVAAAGGPGRFVASSGRGLLFRIDVADRTVTPVGAARPGRIGWDNHMVRARPI